MAISPMSEVIQHLHRTVLLRDGAGLTDGQLLSRFLDGRDQDAFAALVKRHGPMVWGVCRRLLSHHQDAEDAFQATFLILVRKAATVLPREMVANWIYGVACMTAHRANVAAGKRQRREKQVVATPEPAASEADPWGELLPLLDQELSRLPEKYRVVIVLCDLEEKTRAEVARQLGCPEGTVASRLARARAMLARRLARHGLAVTGGTMGVLLSEKASASVPALVVSSTLKGASLVMAGPAATEAISVKVAALIEGVLKAMFLKKLKLAVAIGLVGLAVLVGVGSRLGRTSEPAPSETPKEEVKATMAVTAREIGLAYHRNHALGDKLFQDRQLRATGRMLGVTSAGRSQYWVTLYARADIASFGKDLKIDGVVVRLEQKGLTLDSENLILGDQHLLFKFSAAFRNELAEVDVHQEVTLEGRCEGKEGPGIVFTNCKVIEAKNKD